MTAGKGVSHMEFKEFRLEVKEELEAIKDSIARVEKLIADPHKGLYRETTETKIAIGVMNDAIEDIKSELGTLKIAVYGDPNNGAKGLRNRVSEIEVFKRDFLKIFWILITPLLTLLSGGIIYAIVEARKLFKF